MPASNTMVRKIFLPLLLALLAPQTFAETSPASPQGDQQTAADINTVADAYLAAVEAQDYAEMHELLAENALYEDPTMQFFQHPGIELRGPDAIVGFWHDSTEQTGAEIRYQVTERFTAGPVVVYTVDASVRVNAEFWKIPGTEQVDVAARLVMLIEIHDGRVTRHVDMADYAEIMRQVEVLRAAATPIPD